MSVQRKALLADSTWYGTLAAVRSLSAQGVEVTLACDHWAAPARWSRHCAQVVRCPPSKNASDFLAWLLRFGAEQPGHVFYPTSDELAWLLAAHKEEISKYYTLYSPAIESIVQLLDKARLADASKNAGLEIPNGLVPRNELELEQYGRELGFPLYIKPRAQVFGRGVSKGARVDKASDLKSVWQAQINAVTYDSEVSQRIPDIKWPMLQSCFPASERIYTVDGFVDETGELYSSIACVKVLQRPRGRGAGIIFEHAEIDPAVDEGLRRLFGSTGFRGVFDAEFLVAGDRKLLIDINPRFYNHMAFEIERGLDLPWLAYLGAIGDRRALETAVANFEHAPITRRAYVHRFPTALLLAVQKLTGKLSADEQLQWRRRIALYGTLITEPVRTWADPMPAFAEIVMEAFTALRHPRGYLNGLLEAPQAHFVQSCPQSLLQDR